MIAGLDRPDSGEILVDGKPVGDGPGRDRGMVFQKYTSFPPWLTVADNIAYGPRINGVPSRRKRSASVAHLIEAVGLAGLRESPIRTRSPAGCSNAWPLPAPWPTIRR